MGIELGPVQGNDACIARWDIGRVVADAFSNMKGWRGWISRRLPIASVVARTLSQLLPDEDFNRLSKRADQIEEELAAADALAEAAFTYESQLVGDHSKLSVAERDLLRKRYAYSSLRKANR